MSGVDSSVLQEWLLYWNAQSLCGLGFRQGACAINWRCDGGAWFAWRCVDDDAAGEEPLFTVRKRGRSFVVAKMTETC